jgi:cyclopropane-fatty-acyl-phospholipid synthase
VVAKWLLQSVFRRLIAQGRLTLVWPDGTDSVFEGREDGPAAAVRIAGEATLRRIAANPALGFGEAYMDGALQPVGCSIYDALNLVLTNICGGHTHPVLRWHQRIGRVTRRLHQANTAGRARRNVAHHYDLKYDFYRTFLDQDMQYSCAFFPTGNETLEDAQTSKKRLIAAKLRLTQPGMTVLDIGCGWGGLALTLARDYGARVTGITLSTEQLNVARRRAREAGLAGRVRFECADYRDMTTRFDRVVSVGMMEHVGIAHYGAFFRTVRRCLDPQGVALIHHIARSDGPGSTAEWLDKYIFPGGYSPSLSEVLPAIEQSGLMLTDLEVLRLHYAQTIRHWRTRFAARREDICMMYDERFCRMFEFYLAAAELAFRREREVVVQIQLSPSQTSLPPSRDYLLTAHTVESVHLETTPA